MTEHTDGRSAGDSGGPPTSAAGTLAPPPAPRPITARARWRSWAEPRVRNVWMIGAILLVVGLGAVAAKQIEAAEDRWLFRNGKEVDAEIIAVNKVTRKAVYAPEDNGIFTLQFVPPKGGAAVSIESHLKNQRWMLGPGMHIPLIVDPDNPTGRWTDRRPISVTRDAMLGLIVSTVGLCFVLLAVLIRRQVLRVWRTGQAAHAAVVEVRQSALAPLSRLVRFGLIDGADRRVFTTTVPTRYGLRPGDTFWIVAPKKKPQHAIVGRLYMD